MINRLHAILHRPERGWDPVTQDHAVRYAEEQWRQDTSSMVARLENRIGGFREKRVLDLGGGPGQFSVAFALRGAEVTWHDISRRYREFAEEKANQAKVKIDFSLGYLEDAKKFLDTPFDLVFCRICWRYCLNDRKFARLIFSLVASGGAGYVDADTLAGPKSTGLRRAQVFVYSRCGWKFGHPPPVPGRVIALFQKYPFDVFEPDNSSGKNDRIFFQKKKIFPPSLFGEPNAQNRV